MRAIVVAIVCLVTLNSCALPGIDRFRASSLRQTLTLKGFCDSIARCVSRAVQRDRQADPDGTLVVRAATTHTAPGGVLTEVVLQRPAGEIEAIYAFRQISDTETRAVLIGADPDDPRQQARMARLMGIVQSCAR